MDSKSVVVVVDWSVVDWSIVAAVAAGFLLGALLTWWLIRLRVLRALEKSIQESALREAVATTRMEAQLKDFEDLNQRFTETRQNLLGREQQLERKVAVEAALATQLEESRNQYAILASRLQDLQGEHEVTQGENSKNQQIITRLQTTLDQEKKQMQEKLALLQEARESMNIEFKNIANEIFDNKQKVFSEKSGEQLDSLLKPLSERIKDFEKKVEETYSRESRERFSLIKEVKNLQELNVRISQDAVNLTNALKGQSKAQGTWGEIILQRVLEKSGLQKGREYEIQVSLKNEEGRRLQPDVVVHLPEGKDVIIDSKVSLTAYERFCSAEEEDERQQALRDHIQSLRNHIKVLSDKDYQKLENVHSLDFVLLFLPVEAAFSLAIQHEGDLFGEAFEKNIIMVSPSTLLATLRTIQNIWRYEQQNRNAQEIADRAGSLYDKFVNFIRDLEEIGEKLNSARKSYDNAHNKLSSGRGNLVARAETMRELGAKVSKKLPSRLVEVAEQKKKAADKMEVISSGE